MPRPNATQRMARVTQFMIGLRIPRARSAMAVRGLTQADLDEGKALFAKTLDIQMEFQEMGTDPGLVQQIDAVENEWFPLTSAALQRKFPEVHKVVFLNLTQTQGLAVVQTVTTFVKRIRALETSNDPQHKEARALLVSRGLTEDVIKKAQSLLDAVVLPETPALPADKEDPLIAFEKADAALWDWYLEWSLVARVAIKDRTLLRKMGFLKPQRGGDEEEDGEGGDAEEPEAPVVAKPQPAPPVAPAA